MITKRLGKLSFTYHNKFKNNFELRQGHLSLFITKRRTLALLKFLLKWLPISYKELTKLREIIDKRIGEIHSILTAR